jgi:hypothetical protein
MEIRSKTAISLHRCAVIGDFAKFIPQKELVYTLTQNYTVLLQENVKMNIGHPVSKSKFRTLVKVNLGRFTLR